LINDQFTWFYVTLYSGRFFEPLLCIVNNANFHIRTELFDIDNQTRDVM